MDRDRESIWTRRSGYGLVLQPVGRLTIHSSNKLSLATESPEPRQDAPRLFPSKRYGAESSHGGRSNPFNNIAPLTTAGISSPTGGAANAFNLGSGAFAAFGPATKTPKTPGTAFDAIKPAGSGPAPAPAVDGKREKLSRTLSAKAGAADDAAAAPPAGAGSPWPLKYSWVIWYRPPTSKNSDYEKSTKPMCKISTAQQFWKVYSHLRRPSALPTVSDYHFFKDGIRPVWEDEENRRGGKWIIRLKRGVSDRYWEDLLMAMIGDQFAEAAEEVCGAVLSVRSGEDVFSIWTKNDGGRNIKIRYGSLLFCPRRANDCRETVKRVLALPPDTAIVWKSHDDSIAQRSALDQARQDKTTQQEKRRATISQEDGNGAR
jgi:translation initiation factor 4E